MTYLVLTFFALAGFGFILFQLSSFLLNVGGSRGKMEKDLAELKELISPGYEKLAPIEGKELDLLSMNVLSERLMKGVYYTETGIMYSVYEEPLVQYGFKDYSNNKYVLLAQTKDSEYVFIKRGLNIDLRINNFNQGIISHENKLLSPDGKELASLDINDLSTHHRIVVNQKALGTMLDPSSEHSSNTRVFTMLEEVDSKEEQNLLVAMTIYNILLR